MKHIGLDVGTKNIILAYRDAEGKVKFKREVNGFIILEKADNFAKQMLKMQKVPYVEREGQLIALGAKAEEIAYTFGVFLRRPMEDGVLSVGEEDAMKIVSSIIKGIVGKLQDDTTLYYCVPAPAVNAPVNVQFHQKIVQAIVDSYKSDDGHRLLGHPINEARAIVLSQIPDKTGIGVSFGAGMVNISYCLFGLPVYEFSIVGCLSDQFQIATKFGLKSAIDVEVGDLVYDQNGDLTPIVRKINNGFRETLKSVSLKNINGISFDMTPDHRVLVKDESSWGWKQSEDLSPGDIVGVPTIKSVDQSSYYFGWDNHNKKNIRKARSRNLGRFLGYFLGDGSCSLCKECGVKTFLVFNSDDKLLIEQYKSAIGDLFDRNVQEERDGSLTNLVLHHSIVSRHLQREFYSESECYFSKGNEKFGRIKDRTNEKCENKVVPFSPQSITNQMGLGILQGLIDSDGNQITRSDRPQDVYGYQITNTSISIITMAHHLLNRFGIRHSLSKRDPRSGGTNKNGVEIAGKKDVYEISIFQTESKILDVLFNLEDQAVVRQIPDFMEYEVQSIDDVPYGRDVWDFTVESQTHSISSLGMIVHNCGDWVDMESGRVTGNLETDETGRERPRALVTKAKEEIDLNDEPTSNLTRAIKFNYQTLIENVAENIIAGFMKNESKARAPKPMPIVIAGGTSSPPGFLEMFQQVFKAANMPFEVGDVSQAAEPLYAVAEGCLIASEFHDEE